MQYLGCYWRPSLGFFLQFTEFEWYWGAHFMNRTGILVFVRFRVVSSKIKFNINDSKQVDLFQKGGQKQYLQKW